MVMKNFILLFLVLSLSVANAQHWKKIQNDSLYDYINNLYIPINNNGSIVVGSDLFAIDAIEEELNFPNIGMGFRISNDSGQTFSEVILDGYNIVSFAQIPSKPETWLASYSKLRRGGILLSTDNGQTWDTENEKCDETFVLKSIKVKESNGQEEYFCAAINSINAFKYSNDRFETCTTNKNLKIQSRDIEISKADPNLMFIAADGRLESGVFRSTDNGNTWIKNIAGLEGLRVLCVLPSSNSSALVYCGCDSVDNNRISYGKGIYRSLDTGNTWQLLAVDGARVFDLIEHPSVPDYLVAACGEAGVWVSANSGAFWKQYTEGFPAESSVRSIAVPDWEPTINGIRAYAAVWGDGLYISESMITNINETDEVSKNNIEILNIYPKPFNSIINIIWKNSIGQKVSIKAIDQTGKTISVITDKYFNPGDQIIKWNPEKSISAGVYYLVFTTNSGTAAEKIVKIN